MGVSGAFNELVGMAAVKDTNTQHDEMGVAAGCERYSIDRHESE